MPVAPSILPIIDALSNILPPVKDLSEPLLTRSSTRLEDLTVENVADVFSQLTDVTHIHVVAMGVNWVRKAWMDITTRMDDCDDPLLPQEVNASMSFVGWRATRFLRLLFACCQNEVLRIRIADVIEFMTQILNFLTAADAAGCMAIFLEHIPLFQQSMLDPSNNASTLLIERAVTVSIIARTLQLFEGTVWLKKYGAQTRMFAFLCLPPAFDGISNKCKGRDAPTILRPIPAHPVTRSAEKAFVALWERTLKSREQLGLPAPTVEFADFLLYVKVGRFLQDPPEFVAQCLLEGPETVRAADVEEDDDREEGEEDEDDGERAQRRKQKQADKHVALLNLADSFAARLEDVRKLAQLYLKRVTREKGELKEGKSRKVPDATTLSLWTHIHEDPLAFVEVYESVPELLCLSAQMIFIALKIQCEWPLKVDEPCFLTRWAAKVNPTIVRTYRKTLSSLAEVFTMCPRLTVDSSRAMLIEELTDTIKNYTGMKWPEDSATADQTSAAELPTAPLFNVPDPWMKRHKNFSNLGLPSIRGITELDSSRIEPLSMTSMRQEFYLDTDLPENFAHFPLTQKVRQRYHDYQGKIAIDKDPANGIEEDSVLLGTCLNQWRVLRSGFISGAAWVDPLAIKPQTAETTTGSEEGAATDSTVPNAGGLLPYIQAIEE